MLTETEQKLAAVVLEMAASTYSNHGCNDFDIRQYVPDQVERDALYRAFCEWNGDPEEYYESNSGPDWRMMDWMVMSYLAARLNGTAQPSS